MSSFDLTQNLQSAQEQQAQGEKSFLTQEERDVVKRLLQFPEEFPQEFTAWLVDYLGTAGVYQKYQVQGLPLLNSQVQDALNQIQDQLVTFNNAFVATDETCSSDSFVDLTTPGPNLSGLADGVYLVLFGTAIILSSGTNFGTMTAYANSDSPSESNAITVGGAVGDVIFSPMRAVSMILNNGGSNSVSTKYHKGGSSARFSNRWLTAIRFGDA